MTVKLQFKGNRLAGSTLIRMVGLLNRFYPEGKMASISSYFSFRSEYMDSYALTL